MKRILVLLTLCVLLVSMAACTQDTGSTTPPTTTAPNSTGSDSTTPSQTEGGTQPQEEPFGLKVYDTLIVPGTVFDPAILPQANFVYTIPSCANQGNDDVYSYDTFELTAYNDVSGPVIYSIYLTDPNQATSEGLYMGDDLARVTQLYGTGYTQSGTEISYRRGDTLLIVILQDGCVTSIEYRLAT